MTKKYNTTQLDPKTAFDRHIYHRDMFAHYLRWTYVLNIAKIGMNILDYGCGSGNLYELFYRNRYKPKRYLGLDIREKTIQKNKEKFPKVEWACADLVKPYVFPNAKWDIIASFEVLEHVGKQNAKVFIENIWKLANKKTTVLISTPCYDPKVGAAANHIIDGEVGELTRKEAKTLFKKYFKVEACYGTFASQKDYKDKMTDNEREMFDRLNEYYDSNLVSNIMAPLFPKYSRNCLWVLKKKSKK